MTARRGGLLRLDIGLCGGLRLYCRGSLLSSGVMCSRREFGEPHTKDVVEDFVGGSEEGFEWDGSSGGRDYWRVSANFLL